MGRPDRRLPDLPAWYQQANAAAGLPVRREIEHEMQRFDFTQGAYILPTFMDTPDAYSDKITGYTTAKVGEVAVQLGRRALLVRLISGAPARR